MMAKKRWAISLLVGLIFGVFYICQRHYAHSGPVKPGNVILLDGTSCAGKSAIIQEFKKLHPEYVVIKMDDFYPQDLIEKAQEFGWMQGALTDPWEFIRTYLTEKNNRYYLDAQLRRELFSDGSGRHYLDEAKQKALVGRDVIIDTVLEDDIQYAIFTSTFQGLNPLKVLVYCPLDILLERVEKRNMSPDKTEHRLAFGAFEQFPELYKPQTDFAEQLIDTVRSEMLAQTFDKAMQDFIATGIATGYVPVLEAFKHRFIDHFGLATHVEVRLVSSRPYDVILNSGNETPRELAQKIIS